IDKLESRMETNEQQESFDLILQNDTDINKQFDEIIEADDIDSVMITTRRIRANELRGTTIHLIDQLIDDINMEQSLAIEDTSRSINSSITVLSAINIIAIVSGVAIMLFISFLIRRNLNKVINMTSEVADGNLTVASIDYHGVDEIGQLDKAENQMKENIRRFLLTVTDAAQSVSSSGEQLTQTRYDGNEGGEHSASTIQELSSAAEVQANSASD